MSPATLYRQHEQRKVEALLARLRAKERRCPHCNEGNSFKVMFTKYDLFVCAQCGHMIDVDDPRYRAADVRFARLSCVFWHVLQTF